MRVAAFALAIALVLPACGSSDTPNGSGGGDGGGGGGGGSAGGGDGGPSTPTCATDPLHTGLTAVQTGISVDAFDCPILKAAENHQEPDPMIVKAIIYGESRFDTKAVACPNLPCGTPKGWTAAESGCFGLMQIVPACGSLPNNEGLLSNGHPNMTTDPSSSSWSSSVFNPDVNIDIGISGIAGNRAQVMKQFPGCTVDQYTMMAIGNYANYGSTKSCTNVNRSYLDQLLVTYQAYAKAAGYAAHAY